MNATCPPAKWAVSTFIARATPFAHFRRTALAPDTRAAARTHALSSRDAASTLDVIT
jgi:hypothetical protein